jgi:hypothetical protein
MVLVVLICFVCFGCETLENFTKRKGSVPVISSIKPQVETETVWVPARTKKVWVNPHVDDDGNMIEGHYKYVILEEGHWALQEIAPDAPYHVMQNVKEEKLESE